MNALQSRNIAHDTEGSATTLITFSSNELILHVEETGANKVGALM